MYQLATVELGISPFLFYDLTPVELRLMFEQHKRKKKQDMELFKHAVHLGARMALSKKPKDIPLFEKEEKTQYIDPNEKKKTLEELKNKFS